MKKRRSGSAAAGSVLVITAGIFWGSMGLFVRKLGEYGFSSIQITCLRLTVAALVFAALHIALERGSLMISLRDLPLFLGLGLGSILFFTVCYFTAINMLSLSVAAILLYTSPIWVMLMSCAFFREKLTARKLAALVCAFGGCVLVSGISSGGLSAAGPFLFDPLQEKVSEKCFYATRGKLVPAVLGNEAGMVGAALLARDAKV